MSTIEQAVKFKVGSMYFTSEALRYILFKFQTMLALSAQATYDGKEQKRQKPLAMTLLYSVIPYHASKQ